MPVELWPDNMDASVPSIQFTEECLTSQENLEPLFEGLSLRIVTKRFGAEKPVNLYEIS